MATISQYLIVSGSLLLAFAFCSAIATTTLLALRDRLARHALAIGVRSPLAGQSTVGGQVSLATPGPGVTSAVPGTETSSAISHGLTWAAGCCAALRPLSRWRFCCSSA